MTGCARPGFIAWPHLAGPRLTPVRAGRYNHAIAMLFFDTCEHDLATLQAAFDRRLVAAEQQAGAEETVRAILADVRARGDAAVLDGVRRFDAPSAESIALRMPEQAIAAATERVQQTALWPALVTAQERIERFHEQHRRTSWMDVSRPGETLGQILRPIGRVGVYVPGGTAALSSSLLMAAVPARVAGVGQIVVATPPGPNGNVPDATLAAARLAGVTDVFAMGGAYAIAALAYGTETIARVDKIVGPGNVYVNLAKRLVYGVVGIDLLAGPSEVLALADDSADAGAIAADILTQTEHDRHSSAALVTPSREVVQKVLAEIETQLADLPRADIVRAALQNAGFVVQTRDLAEAAEVASLYAPEHLHLVVRDPWALLPLIRNAAAILMGAHSSAPLGDYLAGPSHTLPTAGSARFASPLNVDDFVKKTSLIALEPDAAARLAPLAATFADFEGLPAHARAARRFLPT